MEDLKAIIDHLELKDIRFVAQSMGGWSCLAYALEESSNVRALVMASTSGRIDFNKLDHPAIDRLETWEQSRNEALASYGKRGIHPAAGARMAREQPELHFLYRAIDGLNCRLDKEAVRGELMALRNEEPEVASALNLPVLFLTGIEDVVFPHCAGEAMAALIPGAAYQCIPDAGHSVYFERSNLFNSTVGAFFSSKNI